MEEINTAKRARYNGVDVVTSTLETNTSVVSDVRENITLAHLDEG